MNIEAIFSGDISDECVVTRQGFDIVVAGASALPSAFGGKAHTCYSVQVTVKFSKGLSQGGSMLHAAGALDAAGASMPSTANCCAMLSLQFNLLRRFSDVRALHSALKNEFQSLSTKM
jgi:hypothetical protein